MKQAAVSVKMNFIPEQTAQAVMLNTSATVTQRRALSKTALKNAPAKPLMPEKNATPAHQDISRATVPA